MSTEGAFIGERYRLDQPIGRGRAGIVWLAYDTRLHRTVAAKQMYLPADVSVMQVAAASSLAFRQGRAATRVVHDCAITVYDVVQHKVDEPGTGDPKPAQPWLIMEYVPSRNMADFIAEHGHLTPEQAAYLGIQLASALIAAHDAGLVHRSLEPGNVLLADDGGVKITDIGVSGAGANPAYQAPEAARGQAAGTASDAFSLGATLYFAIEGVPPFGNDGTEELRPPQHAGALEGALAKLLRADPMSRPTMADTIVSLKAITQGQRTAFIPPTAPVMPTVPVTPFPHPQQQPSPYPRTPPKRSRSLMATVRSSPKLRAWILTALAIFTAVAIGIGLAELLAP